MPLEEAYLEKDNTATFVEIFRNAHAEKVRSMGLGYLQASVHGYWLAVLPPFAGLTPTSPVLGGFVRPASPLASTHACSRVPPMARPHSRSPSHTRKPRLAFASDCALFQRI